MAGQIQAIKNEYFAKEFRENNTRERIRETQGEIERSIEESRRIDRRVREIEQMRSARRASRVSRVDDRTNEAIRNVVMQSVASEVSFSEEEMNSRIDAEIERIEREERERERSGRLASPRSRPVPGSNLAVGQVLRRYEGETVLSRIMHVSAQDAPLSENPEIDLASIIQNMDTPLQLGAGADIVRDADINVSLPHNSVSLVSPTRQQRERGMVTYAAYTLENNPFIQINATYESFGGEPTPDLLTISVVPRANIAIEEPLQVAVEVEKLPPETDISIEYAGASSSVEQRLESLIARFMLANQAVLEETMNPTHPTRTVVTIGTNIRHRTELAKSFAQARKESRTWSQADYAVSLAPNVEVHILDEGDGKYLVGFFDSDGRSLYHDLSGMTVEQYKTDVCPNG